MATATTAKSFISQVQAAERLATRPTPTIHGVDCGRLWIQGVLVACAADGTSALVDDGTGVMTIELSAFLKNLPPGMSERLLVGDYILVIGPLQRKQAGLLAHQVVRLNDKTQRESMWALEVIEYWTSVVSSSSTQR